MKKKHYKKIFHKVEFKLSIYGLKFGKNLTSLKSKIRFNILFDIFKKLYDYTEKTNIKKEKKVVQSNIYFYNYKE